MTRKQRAVAKKSTTAYPQQVPHAQPQPDSVLTSRVVVSILQYICTAQ